MKNMTNIWMLAKANLRKSKSQTIGMLLLILLAAMLLNIGLVMYFRMGAFFDQRADELNSPHFMSFRLAEEVDEHAEERRAFIRDFPNVTAYEEQRVLVYVGNIITEGASRYGWIIIADGTEAQQEQQMNPPLLLGDSLPLTGNAIYLPYFMSFDAGVELGGDVLLEFGGEELHFTLAGATEEIMFGTVMNTVWRVYVTGEVFEELYEKFPDERRTMTSVRTETEFDAELLLASYFSEFARVGLVWINTHEGARRARTDVPLIAALLIAVFSLILMVVAIVSIRFRIVNGIEENMTNIGAQKAVGYRNGQIIGAIVLQFGLVALGGGLLGILAAQPVFPLVTGVIRSMFALPWNPAFDIPMMAASLAAVLISVALFAYITSLRINKLHPLIALRGGITTHSFHKNPAPLDKTPGILVVLLALKQLLTNKKQAIMVSLIIGVVTFAAVSGLAAHYNINMNRDNFIRAITGQTPDVVFSLDITDEYERLELRERLRARPEVVKSYSGGSGGGGRTMTIDGMNFFISFIDDFIYLTGYELVEGRFPLHDNEIALSAVALTMLGKNIGDWVSITGGGFDDEAGEFEVEYLVTGITQSMNHRGMLGLAAARRAFPQLQFRQLNVHLSAGTDIDAFIEIVMEAEADVISSALSIPALTDEQFGPTGDMFAAVTAAILLVVGVVVILVLYLVIKTSILRRRRELGIQKAVGFTTLQLMNQIALSLTPAILAGTVIGASGGYFGFNPIFVAVTQGMGISRTNMPSPLGWTVVMCVALIALSYAVSMLIAWRIRKISAYALVTE